MKYIKCISIIFLLVGLRNDLHAQVPVIKEPHHKPVLANDYVRLLDVHINPHDTTQYHIHAAPSVMVMLSNSTIGIQKYGEPPAAPGNVTAGTTSFVDYAKNPITHRVFNSGDNVFHVMDIELVKKNPSSDSCDAIHANNVETTINEKLVRVYKFDLAAAQSLNITKSSCAHLLICISGNVNSINKKLSTGDYVFFKPNTETTVNNQSADKSTCVVLELK
ncbi:MAG TPA: hypothetical protein VHB70_14595 [Parafilimonas sp.]|nr:hypothetical protein [Parafilimonas sp.]